jgi:cell division protease FtsH
MLPDQRRKTSPPPRPNGQRGTLTPGTPPRRRWPILVVLAALGAVLAFQLSGPGSPAVDEIRYDELKRYVREGRVEWVHLTTEAVTGQYRDGKIPAPAASATRRSPGGSERAERFVTPRVDDETLVPLLEQHRVAFRGAPETSGWGAAWPWMLYIGLSLGLMFMFWRGMFKMQGSQQGGVLAFAKSKGKVYMESEVDVTFEDVAGVPEAKEELQEIVEFLRTPEKYTRLGARIPKGVLLVGPPGTGKTLLARAVAGEAKVPFISISGSEFVEMFVGVGAARVRDLFEQAKKSAPCIVFIDELDALGRSRGGGAGLGSGSNEEREQTLNQLLVEMDGFESQKAVIVMGATNRPEILDPALLRPGRFDRQVLVDRPDKVGRRQILEVHVRGVKLGPDVDLDVIASRTPGFAGADLANLVNEAALLAARRLHPLVQMNDFSDAIDRVIAGLEKKTRILSEDERTRIAYHETGHALAGEVAGDQDAVHKISIIPRGVAALGYTMSLPTEERYLMTESAILAKLVSLLGGRAAEEVVFGEASTGAQNDLQKATDIARAMVTEYGLSTKVGPVHIATPSRSPFLGSAGGGMSMGREIGQSLADLVDAEVRRIIDEAHVEAVRILRTHRTQLDLIAKKLLELEQLEGEQLDGLLADIRRDRTVRMEDSKVARRPRISDAAE